MLKTSAKPAKPYPEFPLFPHDSGKWAKKIAGKLVYFGKWADPMAALAEYQRQYGTAQAVVRDTLMLRDACNLFLSAKEAQVHDGLLSHNSYTAYRGSLRALLEYLGNVPVDGLTPRQWADYKAHVAGTRSSPISVGNEITRIRACFRWLYETREIAEPMHFGPDFTKPGKRAIRKHRRQRGKLLFTAAEINRLLDEAGLHLRAMLLLAVNAGFMPADCAALPLEAVDLEMSWIDFPRVKTDEDRLVPLWPETQEALAASLARRPKPRSKDQEAADRFFVRHGGRAFDANLLSKRFRQLRISADLRQGSWNWIRHTFQTVADGARDPIAVKRIMGHADASISDVYREELERQRLVDVTDHVRAWLF